ncbi:unnamed protein product, partial [Sphagnum compactum]
MRHRSGGRFLIPRPAIQFVWVGRPTPCLPMAASPPSSPSLMDPKATSCLLWVAGRTEAPTPTALSSSPSAPLELWRIGQLFPSLVSSSSCRASRPCAIATSSRTSSSTITASSRTSSHTITLGSRTSSGTITPETKEAP